MLSIQTKERQYKWYTGQANPVPFKAVCNIIDVQADGHELEHIDKTVKGIPTSEQRVVRWFGDDAKFIVANLT